MALPRVRVHFQLPPLSMSPEPLSRFPIRGSGFLALPLTVDSHLMHTSLHFQNPVSITSVHFATSVPTSHCTAPRTLVVLSSAVASITPTRPSWESRLNDCTARSLVLSHVNRNASASPRLCSSFIGFLSSGAHTVKVATLTYKLLESGVPTNLRSRITSKICRRALRSSDGGRQHSNRVHPKRKLNRAPFVEPHRQYGAACRMTLELRHMALFFEADS